MIVFELQLDHLNCITMSILLHSAFMPHYFISSLRSFCLLKVAHLFNCVSLNILSGFLCDFDSALSVTSLSLPYLSFLSSLRVSLGILFSSLLGISLSSSFDPLCPLSLIGLLLPFPSPLPFSTLLSLLLPSLFFPSFESAWAYCSARSWEFFFSLLFLSLLYPLLHHPFSLPLLPLPFLPYSFLPFLCFPASLRNPACGISLSSLHISASLSFSLSLWIRLGILSGSSLGSPPLPSLLLPRLCFFLRSLLLPLPAVSLGILSGSLLLSSLAFVSLPYHLLSSLTLPFLFLLNDVLPY